MNKLLSVIVPVYNVEKYLGNSIESLLAQTYDNIEIVLVDDGSSDSSGIICDEYSRKGKRIKVIHTAHKGVANARNVGLDNASGQLIGWVDSDDTVDPNMFSVLAEVMAKTGSDIVFCDFRRTYEQVPDVLPFDGVKKMREYGGNDFLRCLCEKHETKYGILCNKIFERRLFDGVRFVPGVLHEDERIIHRLAYKANKVTEISNAFYNYYFRKDSIVTAEPTEKRFCAVDAILDRYDFCVSENKFEYASHCLVYSVQWLAHIYVLFFNQQICGCDVKANTKKYLLKIQERYKKTDKSYFTFSEKARMIFSLNFFDLYKYKVIITDKINSIKDRKYEKK